MKKVNFKKLTNQFLAGVFGLALMGGVMLSSQEVDAQWPNITIKKKKDKSQCFHQNDNVEVVNETAGANTCKGSACQWVSGASGSHWANCG